MSKRKHTMINHSTSRKRHYPVVKLENSPPANSIKDLIEIGKSIRFYKKYRHYNVMANYSIFGTIG